MSILLSSARSKKRIVVLGLDGLPLELAKRLGTALPNIGRLAAEATTVRAEIPELSPVNWTSFSRAKVRKDTAHSDSRAWTRDHTSSESRTVPTSTARPYLINWVNQV